MEIEEGEYVRDRDGAIIKVNEIQDYKEDDDIWYEQSILNGTWRSMVKKHSKNIIDLIEVGDFVNGFEIDEFDDDEGNLFLGIPIYDDALMDCILEIRPLDTLEIKTILTHEQYESNCYKLGDEEE